MEKDISFRVPKDLCKDCINSCQFNLKQQTECYLKRKPYILVETEIPTTWQEFKNYCKNIKDCEVKDCNVIFFFKNKYRHDFKLAEFNQEGDLYIAEKNIGSLDCVKIGSNLSIEQMYLFLTLFKKISEIKNMILIKNNK